MKTALTPHQCSILAATLTAIGIGFGLAFTWRMATDAAALCYDVHQIADDLRSLTQPASPAQPAIYPDPAPYTQQMQDTF
jgi:hypothetical protein